MKLSSIKILIVTISCVAFKLNATPLVEDDNWGQTGHRVVGYIAEANLSKKALKKINKLLGGHSIAYYSTYADEIKSDRAYDQYSPWHYVNYPMNETYKAEKAAEEGDLAQGIQKCVQVIKSKNSSDSDKAFHLKLLIHFIGDLHQPLHVGRSEDRGGNNIKVKWFSSSSNLHRVWDSNLIESWGMDAKSLSDELMRGTSVNQRNSYAKGNALDWIEESHQIVQTIYDSAQDGDRLSYRYSYDHNSLLFDQLRKGGYRLAKLLEELF